MCQTSPCQLIPRECEGAWQLLARCFHLISFLEELRGQVGVLFSSHDLHIVFAHAQRVVGLKKVVVFDAAPGQFWDGSEDLLERYSEAFDE